MTTPTLWLDHPSLERSWVVANNRMNRERRLTGTNSYSHDLGFQCKDELDGRLRRGGHVHWLDLCCGEGHALIEAARDVADTPSEARCHFEGVDLIEMFAPFPQSWGHLRFHEASLHTWHTDQRYDLITCVHGFHYIGDKLGLLQRCLQWLKPQGLFLAHFDLDSLYDAQGKALKKEVLAMLREAGLAWDGQRRLLRRLGPCTMVLPLQYLGADDKAGPNFTGQEAVHAYYERM